MRSGWGLKETPLKNRQRRFGGCALGDLFAKAKPCQIASANFFQPQSLAYGYERELLGKPPFLLKVKSYGLVIP